MSIFECTLPHEHYLNAHCPMSIFWFCTMLQEHLNLHICCKVIFDLIKYYYWLDYSKSRMVLNIIIPHYFAKSVQYSCMRHFGEFDFFENMTRQIISVHFHDKFIFKKPFDNIVKIMKQNVVCAHEFSWFCQEGIWTLISGTIFVENILLANLKLNIFLHLSYITYKGQATCQHVRKLLGESHRYTLMGAPRPHHRPMYNGFISHSAQIAGFCQPRTNQIRPQFLCTVFIFTLRYRWHTHLMNHSCDYRKLRGPWIYFGISFVYLCKNLSLSCTPTKHLADTALTARLQLTMYLQGTMHYLLVFNEEATAFFTPEGKITQLLKI